MITTKEKMYQLLQCGDLGNTVKIWNSFTELRDSEFTGRVRIRFRQTSINKVLKVSTENLVQWLDSLSLKGVDYDKDLIFYEAPRDESLLLQGEVMRVPGGLYLRYNFQQEHMKLAFEKENKHSIGIKSEIILRDRCSPKCVDQLNYLLDTYSGHIVEFASYCERQGIYNEDYLIYECRKY